MSIILIWRNHLATVMVLLSLGVFAQSNSLEGNQLSSYLGMKISSENFKVLISKYKAEAAAAGHYLSKDGIELIMKDSVLTEINLYKSSPVYGTFKGTLPHGLRFGMSGGEIKSALGKPSVNYNSGYSEFELKDATVTCWVESGMLTQVGLSAKSK